MMSARPADFGQKVEEIGAGKAPSEVAAIIAGLVDELVSDDAVAAATFVLPGVSTLEDLTAMALALGGHPRWLVGTVALAPPPAVDMVAVGIVRELQFGDQWRPSEALVLGPFPEFPATRCAPVTALEIFLGEPLPQDPKTHAPTTRVNLAHIDLLDRDLVNRDLTPAQIYTMWEKTKAARRESLGNREDNRAKAKVSFVIPTSLARRLGCAP
jgi:hypothetical protein